MVTENQPSSTTEHAAPITSPTRPPHVLVVSPCTYDGCKDGCICARDGVEPEVDLSVECPDPGDHCRTWWTCKDCQRVISRKDDAATHLRTQLLETETAHGVEHWLFSFGWATQGSTCFLQDAENLYEAASEAFDRARRTIAPGRYPVDWDADDTSLNLYLLETEARS